MPLEIERKFLIKMPDVAGWGDYPCYEILQTYLLSEEGVTRRVRMRRDSKGTRYIYTEKRRKSALTAEENERGIGLREYTELCKEADPARTPIRKTRYAIPYGDHVFEVDIYAFWKKQATLEVELKAEGEAFTIPPFLDVLREVTADYRYKNHALAKALPDEE